MELSDGIVTLREWREDDATAVFEACQDPELLRWMLIIPRPYTMEDAFAFVRGEIGYWCAREARGRGVVPRAARLICRHAFESVGVERLQLTADPSNRASQRVVEKVGFRREGVLRSHMRYPAGRRRDSVMFSLLPGELREESGGPGRNG